jgi:hypothetical protein
LATRPAFHGGRSSGAIPLAAVSLVVAVVLAGCGEATHSTSGRSMGAPAETAAAPAAHHNQPPRIERVSLEPRAPLPGKTVRAQVEVVDPDRDPVHLRYRWSVDGTTIAGAEGASLVVPADLARGAVLEVTVTASDRSDTSAPVQARARIGNQPPRIVSTRFDPAAGVKPGDTIVAVVDGTDPDGDQLDYHYEWRVDGQPHPQARDDSHFDTTGLARGQRVSVRVWASDGQDASDVADGPSLQLGNSAPTITSLPPAGMGADGAYHYALEVRDPDGDRNLRFSLGEAPEGAHIDPVLGELTWKPTLEQVGTHPIEVVVRDGHGGETKQRFAVTVRELEKAAAATDVAPPPAAPAP